MIELVHRHILPAAYALLPPAMQTMEATAEILAIGLQESRFEHRQQVGGPAHGFWQFEKGGGVRGVLNHHLTRTVARDVLAQLEYKNLPADVLDLEDVVYGLLPHNDVLSACYARLLLFTDKRALPAEVLGPEAGWMAYVRNWRPGKPHRQTWDEFWKRGWELAHQGV